ncbi:hypothetical protein [Ectobacillus ponti]|uniref:Uncharacterized protein n=1 Tax=Ectobacillus ponti TaxID=2961894 RepID=A0AA41XBQ9_9BACI|nr:hypothetical protein [Ectobacillus ponti]MCP8969106.1 hypothetical protein [Ectobacillus ponti]
MVSQYDVRYEYKKGAEWVHESTRLPATSSALAVRRVADELQRRFGDLSNLNIYAEEFISAPAEEELV